MAAVSYQLSNHLGSVSVRLGSSGTTLDREEYYPFGDSSVRTWSKKRYRYVGKEKDAESKLYYYGARYYSAWTCRFISVDPIAVKFADLSPYNYAGNKPINKMDIDGLQEEGKEESPNNQGIGQNSIQSIGVTITAKRIEKDTIAPSPSWIKRTYSTFKWGFWKPFKEGVKNVVNGVVDTVVGAVEGTLNAIVYGATHLFSAMVEGGHHAILDSLGDPYPRQNRIKMKAYGFSFDDGFYEKKLHTGDIPWEDGKILLEGYAAMFESAALISKGWSGIKNVFKKPDVKSGSDDLVNSSRNIKRGGTRSRVKAEKKIQEYRTTNNPKKGKNLGSVEGKVNGKSYDSGVIESSKADNGAELFEVLQVNNKNQIDDVTGWPRNTDSEFKALNRLANSLNAVKGGVYADVKGSITLVSTRAYCQSCEGVVKQFSKMFPNIKITLVDQI